MKLAFVHQDPRVTLSQWENLRVKEVSAGVESFLVLTEEGEVFRGRIRGAQGGAAWLFHRHAIQPEFLTGGAIQISASKTIPDFGAALLRNGTCKVFGGSSPAARASQWRDLVQVASGDALFGLRSDGRVYHAAVQPGHDDYGEVDRWTDVKRIIPCAAQNGVFGIRHDGTVLCAGSNLIHGPHGDLREKVARLRAVKDICTTGSECQEVIVLTEDGRLFALNDGSSFRETEIPGGKLLSHLGYVVLVEHNGMIHGMMNGNHQKIPIQNSRMHGADLGGQFNDLYLVGMDNSW